MVRRLARPSLHEHERERVSCRGVTHREDVAMREERLGSRFGFLLFSGESVVGLSQDLQSEM